MSSPWDQRYLGEEYVFGTEPNEFIRRIPSIFAIIR